MSVCEEWRLCPQGDSDDSGDGNVGIPRHCHPTGEHPANANCRRGLYPPFSARKATPASEKSPRFFRQRMQGVTHYTLRARSVCQTFPLDSLMVAGLRPAYPPLSASDTRMVSAAAVTVTAAGGIPKLLSSLSPLSPRGRLPAEKERRMTEYALCNPAFPET